MNLQEACLSSNTWIKHHFNILTSLEINNPTAILETCRFSKIPAWGSLVWFLSVTESRRVSVICDVVRQTLGKRLHMNWNWDKIMLKWYFLPLRFSFLLILMKKSKFDDFFVFEIWGANVYSLQTDSWGSEQSSNIWKVAGSIPGSCGPRVDLLFHNIIFSEESFICFHIVVLMMVERAV